ncbi:MAG: hypothetical protein J6W81_03680 [Lentisphaeria bacterium]|nr:hypothetical protein [Lentisphaeria bacterium]
MKIARYEQIISPEVGTTIAGYGAFDETFRKSDDLVVSLLALDDGKNTALILGYDLIGMDEELIDRIRHEAGQMLNIPEDFVILSCTHTHEGPHTRTLADHPEVFNQKYVEQLIRWTCEGIRCLKDQFVEVDTYFYSMKVDANVNRRHVKRDNRAGFFPHCRDLEALADEFCDQELGLLFFLRKEDRVPIEVLVNYAAHPLAAHAPGLGSQTISPDYPGYLRKFIREESGADCIFLSGAAGDMFPKESETGQAAARRMAEQLCTAVMIALSDARRQPGRFKLKNPELKALRTRFEVKRRMDNPRQFGGLNPYYRGKDVFSLPLQFLSIGDIALVGVPGELLAELGQEIKWHSPFRKTFILYASTAYFDYLCHGNALVSGGYEAWCQLFDSRGGLQLVNAAVDGLYRLKGIETIPSLPVQDF